MDISEHDEFDDSEPDPHTKWCILVDMKEKGWLISPVRPNTEVGEYEIDYCNDRHEYRVGAYFDAETEKFILALLEICGNSLDFQIKLGYVLSGVCRSFVLAQENLKKWQEEESKK